MNTRIPNNPGRPWYREPWPWVLIAIPLAAVIASAVTLWLALSRPDHIVVDDVEYERLRAELRGQGQQPPKEDPSTNDD